MAPGVPGTAGAAWVRPGGVGIGARVVLAPSSGPAIVVDLPSGARVSLAANTPAARIPPLSAALPEKTEMLKLHA